jgi:Skp family chaperone for outer membrane proteins
LQTEVQRARTEESDTWQAVTTQLTTPVQDVAEELDEERRSGVEAKTTHVAAISALREETGVLRKEVDFGQRDVAWATASSERLQQELDAARDALQKETERCRAAETRAALLEATLAVQTTEIAALKATGVLGR